MLQRVTLRGIELPRLYIAENKKDVDMAQANGIPYIKWTKGHDALIKQLLRPTLERMFPHIKWDYVLGVKTKFNTKVCIYDINEPEHVDMNGSDDSDQGLILTDEKGALFEVADITKHDRVFDGKAATFDGKAEGVVEKIDIETYVGDMSSYVDLEVLQRLRLMPAFIGDILDCVKINIGSGMRWREGYNKRLGMPVGRYDAPSQLPNLIILDVSASIPRGISATMITLIDTLRTQLSADLIITALSSRFYPMNEPLPTPQQIRNTFGFGNESLEFLEILAKNIRGKRYGHVFSFGDNDQPNYTWLENHSFGYSISGTSVEHVHHYHTYSRHTKTGYAKWCHMLAKEPMVDYDTSWCKFIYN